jgi:hypothetical protein
MSSFTNTKRVHDAPRGFCKFCKDSGESESVFTSHWVKDRDGNITCPKLKNTVCGRCGKKNHTSSYCNTVFSEPATAPPARDEARLTAPTPKAGSRFAQLYDSDSEDDAKLIARKRVTAPVAAKYTTRAKMEAVATPTPPKIEINSAEQFPALLGKVSSSASTPSASTPRTPSASSSYSNIAAMPAPPKPVRQVIETGFTYRPPSPTTLPPRKLASEMNWAMTEDSEEESDYSDEEW